MKKLLIIITLFVSSFFLFCNKEVKAYEYTKELDFSLVETIVSLKEKLDIYIEKNTSNSDYYFINYYSGHIYYFILPLDDPLNNFSNLYSSENFLFQYNGSLRRGDNLTTITPTTGVSNTKFYINSYGILLYANFNLFHTESHSITYTYGDFSYVDSFSSGSKFNTLYDVYLIYSNTEQENPHQEEIDKVTNFYTIVIEKIEYLAEQISNNYILLFTIGIFIITFVFLLIFRRFL